MVGITNTDTTSKEKAERVKHVKRFLRKCSGILKDTGLPVDLTIKEIREMRLNEEYGL
ncbi:MAG: hypothetical protein MUF15_22380 [Acidobacteria bacterium]|jgi:hypothetical protein|nr:hypothetical protein [Acidobacteriota bacterium]